MQSHPWHYEEPTIAWRPGGLPRAGVYLLDGRTHVVAQRSPAERDLLERGAFPVAVLSFDGSPAERPIPDGDIRAIGVREAVERFGHGAARN